MATEAPRMPSVLETVRTYSGLFGLPDRSNLPRLFIAVAVLLAFMLLLPPIAWVEGSNGLPVIIALVVAALGAAYREHRFGGPPRLVLAATLTSLVVSADVIVILIALWGAIGGRLESSSPLPWVLGLFFALPMEVQVASLIGLMILLVVGYFVRKPARQRGADKFEAEVRAERARRGLPTAP